MAEALETVGGDMDILKEIIVVFLESYPDQLKEIKKGIDKSDAGVIEQASHSLKGAVANLSASKAQESAFQLEIIGREGRLEEAHDVYLTLEQELIEAEEALKEILSE